MLALPHLVVWPLLAVVSTALSIVGWLAVLALGRLPGPIHRFQAATVVYVTRVAAYLGLVDDRFPPFPWQRRDGLPVDVRVAPPARDVAAGTLVVLPLSLPAVVTAFFFGLVAWLLAIGAWWAILFTGRMPRTIHEMQGLSYGFQCHTLAYLPLLLTDVYPWYETGPLALRRPPETRKPPSGSSPDGRARSGRSCQPRRTTRGFSSTSAASTSLRLCQRQPRGQLPAAPFLQLLDGDVRSNRPASSAGAWGCMPVAIRSAAMPPQRWPSTFPTPL